MEKHTLKLINDIKGPEETGIEILRLSDDHHRHALARIAVRPCIPSAEYLALLKQVHGKPEFDKEKNLIAVRVTTKGFFSMYELAEVETA